MAVQKTNSKTQIGGYQQVFKNVDDILHKDAGCTSELDYTEQSSWLLFLKYLDALEETRAQEAKLTGKKYVYILDSQYRWNNWAAPRKTDGTPDHHKQQTGPDLLEFVNEKLFPYLRGFKQRAATSNTIEYKIGEIFDEIRNRISSGYNLRDVIDELDKLTFKSQKQKHELSDLYEVKIKNMGNAGRNGGEYYTPRPLIRAIIDVVDPKIGETIYDGACGSAGFLCEAFEHLTSKSGLTTTNLKTLQEKTFYGREKKPLAYVIAVMNMILHGIDAPNVLHANTLAQNLDEIQEKDRYMVVLANPPFGGKERSEVQQNFPIKSSETAYLFLQHFVKILKTKGRAGVVIKNTFLSNTDNASVELRKHLLSSCDLHTVLDLPSGTFQGAGVRTVVLFFEKGTPTKKVWFYQLNPGRNFGKADPLNDDDLKDFITLQKIKKESVNSWSIDVKDIDQSTWDLTVRNPNAEGPQALGTPAEILAEIESLERDTEPLLQKLRELPGLLEQFNGEVVNLESVATVNYGERVVRARDGGTKFPVYGGGGATFSIDRTNRKDCFIVSRFGMSETCVRYVEGEFFLNDSGLTVATRDEETLRQAYLDRVLYARQAEIYSLGTGTAQRNLDVTRFRQLPIAIPAVEVQDRLVAEYDAVSALCDDAKNLFDLLAGKAQQLKSSLGAVFRGEL